MLNWMVAKLHRHYHALADRQFIGISPGGSRWARYNRTIQPSSVKKANLRCNRTDSTRREVRAPSNSRHQSIVTDRQIGRFCN
jgi:hypothetical protein